MRLPIFDGDAIERHLNEDRYHSGGLVAAVDGSLLTWTVNIGVKENRAVHDSSQTRDVDTVTHELGPAPGPNLSIRAKPTSTLNIDQLDGGNVVVSWV